MSQLMTLICEMKEELAGAKTYATCYQKYKDNDPGKAKMYYEMAQDELKHASYMHDFAVDCINELAESNKALAEYFEDMWDETHNKFIQQSIEVKNILSM